MNIRAAQFGEAYLVDDSKRLVVYYSLHSQELKADSFETAAERLMSQALRNAEVIIELPVSTIKKAKLIGLAAHGADTQQFFIGEYKHAETGTVRVIAYFVRGSKAVVVAETKRELADTLVAALSKSLLSS